MISMEETIVSQTKSILSFQRESHSQMDNRLKSIEKFSPNEHKSSEKTSMGSETLGEGLNSERPRMNQRFGQLNMLERTTTIADRENRISEEALSRVIRAEIRSIMGAMTDDIVVSENWKRERLERVSKVISNDAGRSFQQKNNPEGEALENDIPNGQVFRAYPLVHGLGRARYRHYAMKKRSWSRWLPFGILMIHVTTLEPVSEFSNSRIITITATFLPAFRNLLAMSVALRVNVSHAGFNDIGPSFRRFNIIPYDADIWEYIVSGDLAGVQHLFKIHQVSIADCDSDGNTLLHVSNKFS